MSRPGTGGLQEANLHHDSQTETGREGIISSHYLKNILLVIIWFVDYGKFEFRHVTPKDVFSSISDNINSAVRAFISQYESRCQRRVLHHYLDKNTIDGGASMASGVVRLNFSFASKDEARFRSSVLLKIPQMGPMYDHSLEMLCYQKELYVYKEVLPRMYAHWPDERPFPTLYTSTDCGILIMENLRECGFHPCEKGSLLDLVAAKVALRTLAQFHALSTALPDEIHAALDGLTVTDFGGSEIASQFVATLSEKFRRLVLPSLPVDARVAFERLIEDFRAAIELGNSPNKGGLNVILHGDAHCYNMLFAKNRANQVAECKLIDFQATRRGSPVVDLIFFLATSVQFEVFLNHRDCILEYYLAELESALQKIPSPCKGNSVEYSANKLQVDLRTYKPYFLYILLLTPVLRANQLKANFKSENDALEFVLSSEKYISTFKGWIKCLELADT